MYNIFQKVSKTRKYSTYVKDVFGFALTRQSPRRAFDSLRGHETRREQLGLLIPSYTTLVEHMRGSAKTRADEGVGGVSELNIKSFVEAQNLFRAARIAAAARARGAVDTPTATTVTAASANSAATPHTLAASAAPDIVDALTASTAQVDVVTHIASAVLHEPVEGGATTDSRRFRRVAVARGPKSAGTGRGA